MPALERSTVCHQQGVENGEIDLDVAEYAVGDTVLDRRARLSR
jgi:hypothetical protein